MSVLVIRLQNLSAAGQCPIHMPPQVVFFPQQIAFVNALSEALGELAKQQLLDPRKPLCCQLGDARMEAIHRQIPGVWALRN